MLCAAGQARKVVYGFVSLDSIPLEPHFRAARQARHHRGDGARRGDVAVGAPRRGDAGVVPALPGRARLRHHGQQPRPAHGRVALRRRGARRHARVAARRRAAPRQPGRPARQRPVPRTRLVLRRRVRAWPPQRTFVSCERVVDTEDLAAARLGADDQDQPALDRRGRRSPASARTSPTASPTTPATRPLQRDYAASAKRPRRRGRRSGPGGSTCPRPTTGGWPRRLAGAR